MHRTESVRFAELNEGLSQRFVSGPLDRRIGRCRGFTDRSDRPLTKRSGQGTRITSLSQKYILTVRGDVPDTTNARGEVASIDQGSSTVLSASQLRPVGSDRNVPIREHAHLVAFIIENDFPEGLFVGEQTL